MITQEEYYQHISVLGYTKESANQMFEAKSGQLVSFEQEFRSHTTHAIEENLTQIEGMTEEMFTAVFDFISKVDWNHQVVNNLERFLMERFKLEKNSKLL